MMQYSDVEREQELSEEGDFNFNITKKSKLWQQRETADKKRRNEE